MAKLFEAAWRDGYSYFERFYDTDLQKSVKERINTPAEWYTPSSTGLYSFILDDTIKLEKKQGRAKEGRDQYGFLDPMYRHIRDEYWNKDKYNKAPRTWYLDIETRVELGGFPEPKDANERICLFQIYDSVLNTMFVLGLRDWKHQSDYSFGYDVRYVNCKDEVTLINTFLDLFKKLNPLLIYAWNGTGENGFDFPYIYNRMKNLGMDTNRLSNYGDVTLSESEYKGKTLWKFSSVGHFFVDMLEVYEKFEFDPVPNYKLDTIAEIVLKEKKVPHTEYAAFDDFYTGKYIIPPNPTDDQKNSKIYKEAVIGNWDEVRELAHSEFVYYGITDTYLIKKIDDAKNFTQLMLMIAEKMGVQMGDAMGTVKPWSQYISNKAMLDLKVMPPRTNHPDPSIVGGFVRDPVVGRHRWVITEDVTSMYPLLGMVGFNMSPETFVSKANLPPDLRDVVLSYFNDQNEDRRFDLSEAVWNETTNLLKKYDMSLGINGAAFSRSKLGMIPEMVLDISGSRKTAQKKKFKYEQQKILIGKILKEKENGQA